MFVLSFLTHFIREFMWQILMIPVGIILLAIGIKVEYWIRAKIKKRKEKRENINGGAGK